MRNVVLHIVYVSLSVLIVAAGGCQRTHAGGQTDRLERITISDDGKHFVKADSKCLFVPWGFNYDRDTKSRLIEDYWITDWPAIEAHFAKMKSLGANVVRIHLQLGKFMKDPMHPDRSSLARLSMLIRLAETTGLYLDITGLGCYHKQDIPPWYDALDEAARWDVQARFWQAVTQTCADSPAVFCFDLMNEPVVTGGKPETDWLAGEPLGGKYYVQRINLDPAGRTPEEIASQWLQKLTCAIREFDPDRLLTVGVIPWSMIWPDAKPTFYSPNAARRLDFVSVHFYPKQGEIGNALKALSVYDIGKPLVIEEMFNLACDIKSLDEFVEGSRAIAEGWLGFFWGDDINDCTTALASLQTQPSRADQTEAFTTALTLQWLEYFEAKTPGIVPDCK